MSKQISKKQRLITPYTHLSLSLLCILCFTSFIQTNNKTHYEKKQFNFTPILDLPTKYLVKFVQNFPIKECKLSQKYCGSSKGNKFCAKGCCVSGKCDNSRSYCETNSSYKFSDDGFVKCLSDLNNARSLPNIKNNNRSTETQPTNLSLETFKRELKKMIIQCPINSYECGEKIGFCSNGCCSDDSYCGKSEFYCAGFKNQPYDSDQIPFCMDKYFHNIKKSHENSKTTSSQAQSNQQKTSEKTKKSEDNTKKNENTNQNQQKETPNSSDPKSETEKKTEKSENPSKLTDNQEKTNEKQEKPIKSDKISDPNQTPTPETVETSEQEIIILKHTTIIERIHYLYDNLIVLFIL